MPLVIVQDKIECVFPLYFRSNRHIRAIGVSNFDGARLADLCLNSKITPMVNQIELHPFHQQLGALKTMKEYQVQPEGWVPFCEGQKLIFQNKVLVGIGKKYGKTVAQVILRFHMQRGVAVIPGSSKKEHIWENMDIWDFKLSETDMEAIEGLPHGFGIGEGTVAEGWIDNAAAFWERQMQGQNRM